MSDKSVANRLGLLALTLAAGQLACGAQGPGNHVAPVVTEKVDEANLVALTGNVRPEAKVAAYDQGRVDDSFSTQHMLLQLRRSPIAEQALEQLIKDLENPASPSFHQWLTPEQYGDQFGLADSDLEAVRGWLTSHGLSVNSTNPARTLIDFSGTAGQVLETFHTELHRLNVKGAMHLANTSNPQIPVALTKAIVGVVSLNDFRPHNNVKPKPEYTFTDNGTIYAIVPADLQTIYNLTPLYAAGITGAGTTVVVVEDTDVFNTADWQTFRTKFGLDTIATGTLTQIHPASGSGTVNNCTPPGVNSAESEAILDTQWASASAPGANIVLASCADTDFAFGGLLALSNLLNGGGTMPDAVSVSYGTCETENGAAQNAAFASVYQQAVAQGVPVFVASGDEGAASCDANQSNAQHGIAVSGFASTPYNVAVGGTDFGDSYQRSSAQYWASASGNNPTTFGSAKSYIPEIPWNDSCASQLFADYNLSADTFGSNGFCNSSKGERDYLTTGSGSGGPSGCATGSGSNDGVVSGDCRGWAKPDWQAMVGVPDDGVRDIPDVSLFAANGYWNHYLIYCDTDKAFGAGSLTACSGAPSSWPGAGGTSFASPIMAGIQALVNQKWQSHFGLPNTYYYAIANAEYGTAGSTACDSSKGASVDPTCSFYDVTLGDIDVNCLGPYSCYTPSGTNGVLSISPSGYGSAFPAHTGWDFATGIGSINANNLVNNAAWSPSASRLSWSQPHQ